MAWTNVLCHQPVFRNVVSVINGGVQFGSNIQGVEHELDFNYQSNAITFPVDVAWPYTPRPKALTVVSATEDDSEIMCQVAWVFTSEGKVRVSDAIKFTNTGILADFAAATGTADRTTFATGSVTLSELAERVKAIIDDFQSSPQVQITGLETDKRYRIRIRVTP